MSDRLVEVTQDEFVAALRATKRDIHPATTGSRDVIDFRVKGQGALFGRETILDRNAHPMLKRYQLVK